MLKNCFSGNQHALPKPAILPVSTSTPEPTEQMLELIASAEEFPDSVVPVPVTRPPAEWLKSRESIVAFYSNDVERDAALKAEPDLLATGIFETFIGSESKEFRETFNSQPIFADGIPDTVVGFVMVYELAGANCKDVACLSGVLENGEKLTNKWLSRNIDGPNVFGRKTASVWFIKSIDQRDDLIAEERIALLRAKTDELLMKTSQLAGKWQKSLSKTKDLKGKLKEFNTIKESRLKTVGRKDIQKRLEKMLTDRTPKLSLERDSARKLIECLSNRDGVWRIIYALNDDGKPERGTISERFEGTDNWIEIKPLGEASVSRIYYRNPMKGTNRIPVLVSEKADQVPTDKNFMRARDGD